MQRTAHVPGGAFRVELSGKDEGVRIEVDYRAQSGAVDAPDAIEIIVRQIDRAISTGAEIGLHLESRCLRHEPVHATALFRGQSGECILEGAEIERTVRGRGDGGNG
jgi:hypothetical protein